METYHIFECVRKESCLGGFSEDLTSPVECSEGYEGLLCTECSSQDDTSYERSFNFVCSK